ncbi:MAG: hypothetical protein JNK24_05550 [Alphaproteobacteria bacterium]|nr:hypothetical protein [Alphaproteobacteria bacterium]
MTKTTKADKEKIAKEEWERFIKSRLDSFFAAPAYRGVVQSLLGYLKLDQMLSVNDRVKVCLELLGGLTDHFKTPPALLFTENTYNNFMKDKAADVPPDDFSGVYFKKTKDDEARIVVRFLSTDQHWLERLSEIETLMHEFAHHCVDTILRNASRRDECPFLFENRKTLLPFKNSKKAWDIIDQMKTSEESDGPEGVDVFGIWEAYFSLFEEYLADRFSRYFCKKLIIEDWGNVKAAGDIAIGIFAEVLEFSETHKIEINQDVFMKRDISSPTVKAAHEEWMQAYKNFSPGEGCSDSQCRYQFGEMCGLLWKMVAVESMLDVE